MFEIDSTDHNAQSGLQDITERMSLLLTSYEGPSDRLSQRLALKREKEHNEMKAVIRGVLADFNRVIDEREALLASVKKWFDVSCKLFNGVDSDGNADEVWNMIENEMKKLFGVLQTFKNSSQDITELEQRLLKIVFKDTNVGDLEEVRNKINFNSFRRRTDSKLTSVVEKTSNTKSTDPELVNSPDRILPLSPIKMSTVEIQVDLVNDPDIDVTIIEKLVHKEHSKSLQNNKRISVAVQAGNLGKEHNFKIGNVTECLAETLTTSISCLDDCLADNTTESNLDTRADNRNFNTSDFSRNETQFASYKQQHNITVNNKHISSTPNKRPHTPINTPSIHIKNSPVLSPISPKSILSTKQASNNSPALSTPNLSFLQKEQIKHDNIELYLTKYNGRMKHRLLIPITDCSPKKNSVIRTLGIVRLCPAQPTHIFKQDDQTEKWGQSLVDVMKDMCID